MDDYPRLHRERGNLLIHIVAVPTFVVTALAALWCLLIGEWTAGVLFASGPALSLAAQGYGHRREPDPPRPFRGPLDFGVRVLTEQFVRFPVFVATGGWARAVRESALSRPT